MSRECLGCGRDVPVGMGYCPYCTAPFKEPKPGPAQSVKQVTDETVFYSSGGIQVTTTRLITGNQTYAMRNITSVKKEYIPRKTGVQVFICFIVFISGALVPPPPLFGLLASAGVAFWFWKNGAGDYQIIVSTAAGESPAYTHSDLNVISNVHKAISDAIVARG